MRRQFAAARARFATLAFVAFVALSVGQPAVAGQSAPSTETNGGKGAGAKEDPKPAPTAKLTIDLAAGTVQSWPVEAGTYGVQLANAIPGESYSVIIGVTALSSLPPLQVPSASEIARSPLPPLTTSQCTTAAEAAKKLVAATSESDVPTLRKLLQVALLECGISDERTALMQIVSATTVDFPDLVIQIPAESRKTVTVVRGPVPPWTVTYSTTSHGQWQALFGWTFAPNRDQEYFSKAGENEKFVVTKRANQSRTLTSLPSVFWTYLPTDQAYRALQHGPTLGLGVTVGDSGSRAAVFGGYTVRFHQNIGVVAGVAIYPHRRLDTKYTEGQTIEENLESDQLNRSVLRGSLFVGAVLRCGSDPRKASESPGAKSEAPPEDNKTKKTGK